MSARLQKISLNFPRLVMLITLLAVFAMAARVSVDTDTWWHLRAGQWIVENRSIPQVDPFSYTRAGESWLYPGWLVEVPMFWLFQTGGPGFLNLWTTGMVTLAFLFIWYTLSGGSFLRAFAIILAATVSAVYWAARPYLVTFLMAAIYLWIFESYRWKNIDHLWWLPVLMLVWVNSHGGFVVGFLLWGIYAAYALIQWLAARLGQIDNNDRSPGNFKRLLLIGFIMLIVVFINPSGAAMYVYAFKTVGISALQDYIQEWQSPNFHLLHVQPFAWLLLLTFGAVGASRKRLALTDFLLLSGFAFMGLLAGRNVALFALAAPIVLTRHTAPLLSALGRKFNYRGIAATGAAKENTRYLNWVLLLLVTLAVVIKSLSVMPESVNEAAFRQGLPIEAVEYLRKTKPQGRLFNTYNWGSYLLWALPDYPVFIDGRTDLYSDEVVGDWLQVMRAESGWQDILSNYDVNLILIENGAMLDRILETDPSWVLIYEDILAVIYQTR